MIKRKAGRPAKQKRQQQQKKTKIIQEIAAISVNEDHEPGIPINDVESLIKQFWKDSGTDEFDAEALKNEEVSELDLKKNN